MMLTGCKRYLYLQKEPDIQQKDISRVELSTEEIVMGEALKNPNKYKYPLIQFELSNVEGHCQLVLHGAITDNEGNIWIIEE
jgi:hypothetical protein